MSRPIVPSRAHPYDPLYTVFGVVLIGTGLAKFVQPNLPESTLLLSLIPRWVFPLVPLYEIALGVWLVSGWMRFGAWVASLATLLIFALHNLELLSAGRPSCGCLGAVDVSPGYMLTFDLILAVLLLKRRPRWAGWPADSPRLRQVALTGAVMAGVLGAAAGVAYWQHGSVAAALAALRDEPLAVVPADLGVGAVASGTVVEATVRVHNLTGEPAHLAYAKGSCACAEFPDLPLVVPPHGTADVRVRVTVSGPEGSFRREGVFRTNVGHVRFGIRGRVLGGRESGPTSSQGGATP